MRVALLLPLLALAACGGAGLPLVLAIDLGAPGLEDDFDLVDEGGLWSVGEFGPGLRVLKAADPGTDPGFVHGGVASQFTLNGDFAVTVSFDFLEFPAPAGAAVNEAMLAVARTSGRVFRVVRQSGAGGERVLALVGEQVVGEAPSTLLRGQLRIRRVSVATLIAEIAAPGGDFVPVAQVDDLFSGPARVELLARQGSPSGGPRTPLDIAFDELVVEAISITGLSSRLRPFPEL